jgi:MFS family permease
VLLPFRIKEELGATAGAFGLVLAASGAGGAIGSAVIGQRATPRRPITFLYWVWGLATLALCGYGLATAVWQLFACSLVFGFLSGLGNPVWSTLMQVRVPAELRGRVSSLDWLVSVGLTPLSFALTGPIAHAAGAQATLVGAGLIGTFATFALLYGVPGLRNDQEDASKAARSAVNVG